MYDVASELIQQLVDAEAQQWLEQQSSQGVREWLVTILKT